MTPRTGQITELEISCHQFYSAAGQLLLGVHATLDCHKGGAWLAPMLSLCSKLPAETANWQNRDTFIRNVPE